MDGDGVQGGGEFLQFLGGEGDVLGGDVLQEVGDPGGAGDGDDPRLLGEVLGQGDLGRGGALADGPVLQQLDQRHVGGPVLGGVAG